MRGRERQKEEKIGLILLAIPLLIILTRNIFF
jgi:hypothetical protein